MRETNFDKKPIDLYTPAGIGDALWCLMLVCSNTNRPVRLHTFTREGKDTQFLKCIPSVISIDMFDGEFIEFKEKAEKYRNLYLTLPSFDVIDHVYLNLNPWLESNRRLEDFLPNMSFHWNIPWKISEYSKAVVDGISNKPIVCIYTSSVDLNRDNKGYERSRLYDYWTLETWKPLISVIKGTFKDINIVWLGSKNDVNTFDWLSEQGLAKDVIPWVDQDGELVVELLNRSRCFISFQSGLSVISVLNRVPTYMLYFKHVNGVMRSWCPPDVVNNPDIYRSILFDDWSSGSMLRWMKKHLQ